MLFYFSAKVIIFAALTVLPIQAQSQPLGTSYTALINVNLIDGTGKPPQPRQTILIRGEHIAEVGAKITIPKEAKVIDLSGKTVIPGLIDMHGHLYANTKGYPVVSQFESYPPLYLAGGVTTIRSPGEFDPEEAIALRERVKRHETIGPRMFIYGPYFTGDPSDVPWMKGVKSPEEALELFSQWKDKIDGVKFYMNITEPEFRTVLQAAHDNKLSATGHLDSISATQAIELGIDGLEHGIFAMPELTKGKKGLERYCPLADLDLNSQEVSKLINLIVSKKVVIDPTIITFEASLLDFQPVVPDFDKYFSPETKLFYSENSKRMKTNVWDKNSSIQKCIQTAIDKQKQFIKKIHDRGGIIVAGTDPISIALVPGYSLHRELKNLVDAGLTPIQAIKAATFDAAAALHHQKDLGSVEKGKFADLVVLSSDPSIDITNVGKTEIVFLDGIQYDPSTLRKSAEGMIK